MGKQQRPPVTTKREIVHQGGLLKHGRKKVNGFNKRWFTLDSNGVLSYALSPKARIRDSINVGTSTIARSKQSKSIHIDSDRVTWHLKAQTDSDFQTWTAALRKFIPVMEKGGGGVAGNVPQKPEVNMAAVSDYLTRMTAPIKDLELILGKMEGHDNQSSDGTKKPLQKIKSVLKPSSNNNNSEAQDEEANDLRKAHAQIFRYHQRLLELVSPSKAAGPLAPEEGAVEVDKPLIASRTAIGFKSGGGGADSDDDWEDAREFDLDEDGKSGYNSSAAASSAQEDDDDDSDSGDDSSSQTSVDSDDTAKEGDVKEETKRRDKLPKSAAGDPSGAFSVLKNNIGKDLTKISFPVSFNEPLSALQRQAEELENAYLLKKAASAKAMTEKLAYIAAFAVSGLSGTKTRAARKPFNPLLGETYELIRPDKQFKFFSEKVSHHPPINAFWAQDDNEKWTLSGATTASQKYWGRSLEVFPGGSTKLKLGEDEFVWEQRPNATVRGMMGGGEKTLEYSGKLIIKHTKSKAKVTVAFKEGSKFGGGDKGKLEGKIVDDSGNESGEITGKWDEVVQLKTGQDSYKELFKYKGISKDSDCGFGWSVFACQLNEITDIEKDKLPVTDTRLRPDQRSYEEGDEDSADKQKENLENAQRERRKKWEEGNGKEQQPPKWFKKGKGEHDYDYNGKYFEKREKGEWPEEVSSFKIFDDA